VAKVLGISAYYHDSAAALIIDGEIIAAAQEERFTRKKHDSSFPRFAIEFCLTQADISFSEIDYLAFYDKPFLKFERLLETYIAFAPKGFSSFRKAIPTWLREKLFMKDMLLREIRKMHKDFEEKKLMFSEHHLSHSASAFFPSTFQDAVILTVDGVGEWATASISIGHENSIEIIKEIHFPHSLGLLYSAVTYYLGFKVNSGEYKVMGLAPYGRPKYKETIMQNLIDVKEDGSFRLNQKYFNYASGLTMTNEKFSELFGKPVRVPESNKLTQFHMDMAASIQVVTEEVMLKIVSSLSEEFNQKNLCLAGGVALNCVANGKIQRSGYFENIWVQPAAGDAGGAVGAALAIEFIELKSKRVVRKYDGMKGCYLGPSFTDKQVETGLTEIGAKFKKLETKKLLKYTAKKIADDNVVGWFQGQMEFGPRALGNRSILANPLSKETQKNLNLKIKFRESFRPFAPSILADKVSEWFDTNKPSPYMLLVNYLKKEKFVEVDEDEKNLRGIKSLKVVRSEVPAITHVDYSARIQTVDNKTNQIFYDLISEFYKLTDCPILVNTSFNVRGEPIVCDPKDAFNCFMGTNMDILVVGNFVLEKIDQDPSLLSDYKSKYELD